MYVTTNIAKVQADLISKIDAKDILIGHSLDSDLLALKLFHASVVDTSVVYPHTRGPPFKKALKTLAENVLGRRIQDEGGHDSKEDALACLDIMKSKAKAFR
jgi:RNA exonuclease 1